MGILDSFVASCGEWNNLLVLAGIFYMVKLLHSMLLSIIYALKAYVIPRLTLLVKVDNFVEKYGEWAVVTGCTGGIGQEYASQLAGRGMNLVLVSRSKAKLEAVARDLQAAHGVQTLVIVADFTDARVLPKIVKQIKDAGVDVGILVNNVGLLGPHFMPFLELDGKTAQDIITVNINAATVLCHQMLPDMLRKGKGAIINISSMASYSPMPYLAVYAATKHYMSAFTDALQAEYSDSGVVIQEIDPGQVATTMTELFEQQPEFIAPSAATFVASAIGTLGFTARTCGWWVHSLMAASMLVWPEWLMAIQYKSLGKQQYLHALKENAKNK